jgi:hypothetical protein
MYRSTKPVRELGAVDADARRSATWAKAGEGHAVTGSGTGIVASSTYFPRQDAQPA